MQLIAGWTLADLEKIWHWSSVELDIAEVEKDDGYLKHALNRCFKHQALFMVNIEYRNAFAISNKLLFYIIAVVLSFITADSQSWDAPNAGTEGEVYRTETPPSYISHRSSGLDPGGHPVSTAPFGPKQND